MTRRVAIIYTAWIVASTLLVGAVMSTMTLLGARDELTVVATIIVFVLTAFVGGFLPSPLPPDRR